MKRFVAIMLSLIFAWLQAVASVQASVTEVAAKRSCCSCNKSCCVSSSGSTSRPLPAPPPAPQPANDLTALTSPAVLWILPAPAPLPFSASALPPSATLPVPLFTRDCARLI